jgi:hypothetical protein
MYFLQEDARPEPCNENLIINELIREYLIFNGYRDTLSVFLPGERFARCKHGNKHMAPAPTLVTCSLISSFSCRQQELPAGNTLHTNIV